MLLQEVIDFLGTNVFAMPVVEAIVINPRFSGVYLDNGTAGIADNLFSSQKLFDDDTEELLKNVIGGKALTVAKQFCSSQNSLLTSLGVAILNALSQPYVDSKYLQGHGSVILPVDEQTLLNEISEGAYVIAAGVSEHIQAISEKAGKVALCVLEPDHFRPVVIGRNILARGPLGTPIISPEQIPVEMGVADIVLVNDSTLVTGALPKLLNQVATARVIIHGPTAALHPPTLFRWGINSIITWKITNPDRIMRLLANTGLGAEAHLSEAAKPILIRRIR